MKRTKKQILAEIRSIKSDSSNYTESVIREDPYSLVAKKVLEKVPHSTVFEGKSFKEVRAIVKPALMTVLYNSKQEPINVFGEDTPELEAFYTALHELFPGALNVMEALNNRWDNTATYHEFVMPDGHVAHVKVIEAVDGTLDNEGLNLPYRYKVNQASTNGTSIVANFTHACDAFIIRYVVDNADFQVAHIHDAIGFHPNNGSKVRELYKEAFAVLSKSKVLEEFCEQDFGIDNNDFLNGLKTSSYALC